MTKIALMTGVAVCAMGLATAVMANEPTLGSNQTLNIEQASQLLQYSGGNDSFQVQIAPNYSKELGFSLKGATGGYLTDAMALGLIVEYGQNKQEYLGNLGFQLSDNLSLIGTVGLLAEDIEFGSGEEDKASQMEYGLSLKADSGSGLGLELNGYAVNAKASNDSIETGDLYGAESLLALGLAGTTLIKLGGGYEWLEWDGGEKNNQWTFRSEANQKLTDMLRLQGHAKLGASERSYGGGLSLNLSDNGTNLLGLNYTHIDGRNGIADDQRVEISWTYGLGSGPSSKVAVTNVTDQSGTITAAAADAVVATPDNDLLRNVMKRPAFLPERVLARAAAISGGLCSDLGYEISGDDLNNFYYSSYNRSVFFFVAKALVPEPVGYDDYEALSPSAVVKLDSVVIPLQDGQSRAFLKFYDSDPQFVFGQEYTITINDGPISCEQPVTPFDDDN